MTEMVLRSYFRVRIYTFEAGQKTAVVRERLDGKEEENVIDPETETIASLMRRFKLP
jgi:hypothetical protein